MIESISKKLQKNWLILFVLILATTTFAQKFYDAVQGEIITRRKICQGVQDTFCVTIWLREFP